jgi:hypothetical protein
VHNPGTTPGQAYLDYADSFPFVGWVGTINENGQTVIRGSGVLIDPHWILTAAHAVLQVNNNPVSVYQQYRAGFIDNFFNGPGENRYSSTVYVHPDYDDVLDGPDLALLHFETAFTLHPVELYEGSHIVGAAYDIAGFGRPGTPATGLQSTDGRRRAGTNLLTDIDSPDGYMRARFLSPAEQGFMQLGMLGTPGDSGGGWFVTADGEKRLAGSTSDWDGFAGYGGRTYATYFTPEILDWIESTMGLHSVPEPSSITLSLCALLAFSKPRYRRRVIAAERSC